MDSLRSAEHIERERISSRVAIARNDLHRFLVSVEGMDIDTALQLIKVLRIDVASLDAACEHTAARFFERAIDLANTDFVESGLDSCSEHAQPPS